ncbi:MAG: Mg-chelatase subunit ChlD [Planctomycetota bacterium]|nr:Mg-chelatase subunit ChlD [Planctomycetota bacterium]
MAAIRAAVILGCLTTVLTARAVAQEIIVKPEGAPTQTSEFLRPPGTASDPYAPSVDWARVPPWRKTEFFGIRAQGKTFLYVVDCSGSMGSYDRLVRAKREIRRSIGEMRFPQRFQIIFYNDRPYTMPGGMPQGVDYASKTQLSQWMSLIDADGGTDPRGAMAQALAQRPDAIFLLSDGEFPTGAAEAIAKKNPKKVPIHCVDFAGNSADLKKIARESGGVYASRP